MSRVILSLRALNSLREKVVYLKFILEKGGTVKTTEISSSLQVDPSTTSKTLNELATAGYLNHIPYRGVDLTELGEAYAEFLVRRHRILSLLLTHYGLSSEEACDEVSRFESFVSRRCSGQDLQLNGSSDVRRMRRNKS